MKRCFVRNSFYFPLACSVSTCSRRAHIGLHWCCILLFHIYIFVNFHFHSWSCRIHLILNEKNYILFFILTPHENTKPNSKKWTDGRCYSFSYRFFFLFMFEIVLSSCLCNAVVDFGCTPASSDLYQGNNAHNCLALNLSYLKSPTKLQWPKQYTNGLFIYKHTCPWEQNDDNRDINFKMKCI